MPAVPLGREAYERQRGVTPEVQLKNLYLEEDKSGVSPDGVLRLQRPGLTALVDFGAAIRGIYQLDGVLGGETFVAAGDKLYSTDLATKTFIGTIPDDGAPVKMVANALKLAIVSGGTFLTYDGEDLVTVELPDDESPVDLDTLNAYFILILSNGRIRWLRPEADDFSDPDDVLAYATAEGLADGLMAVRKLRDELFLLGTNSIEVWQPTGDAESAYERAPGRTIDRGTQSRDCVVNYDNSIVFVGEDGLVYKITDVPKRISTNGIEERIAKRTNSCSAFTFTIEGHPFYCLAIPGQGCFAYDASSEAWSEFGTLGKTGWDVTVAVNTQNGPLAGDAAGFLSKLDADATTDRGTAIERIATGTVAVPAQRAAVPHLAIHVGVSEDVALELRWRDGRGDWSNVRPLTARSGFDVVNAWRLGATKGAFRTFEIRTVADAQVNFAGAVANEGRATG